MGMPWVLSVAVARAMTTLGYVRHVLQAGVISPGGLEALRARIQRRAASTASTASSASWKYTQTGGAPSSKRCPMAT